MQGIDCRTIGLFIVLLVLAGCKTPVVKETEILVRENKINPSFTLGWSPLKQDTVNKQIFVLDTMINVTVKDSVIKNVRVISLFDTLHNITKLDVDFEPIVYYDTVIVNNTIIEKPIIPWYMYLLLGISLLVAVIVVIKK